MSDLLDAVDTAHGNIERLADPSSFRIATDQVAEVVRQCGARSVLAASAAAERLVGALLASCANLVNLPPRTTEASCSVLIIDINLASGTTVAQAAQRARGLGARHVQAVVLHQVTAATVQAADCGVDTLTVLGRRPAARPSSTTDSGLW